MKTIVEIKEYLLTNSVKNAQNLLDIEKCLNKDGIDLPDNILVHSGGVGSTEFITWYESTTYPKSFDECKMILQLPSGDIPIEAPVPYSTYAKNFIKLIICRNAYWKIYGEQMELDKPWEPDWTDDTTKKYCIRTLAGEIVTNEYTYKKNHILAFPTEELTIEFYRNFKNLIEQCMSFI